MRVFKVLVAAALGVAFAAMPKGAAAVDLPLSGVRIKLKTATPGKQGLSFKGKLAATLAGSVPNFVGATLNVSGAAGEGTSGDIVLDDTLWTALSNDKGYKYVDKAASAGGVRKILFKNAKPGKLGSIKVVAGKANFVYTYVAEHSDVFVTLTIDGDTYCGNGYAPSNKNGKILAKGGDETPPGCDIETIVDVAWLEAHLDDAAVQIVDSRVGSYPGGHIPGALPLDPYELADTIGGIAFQMVDAATAESVVDATGLANGTTVVVYGAPPEIDPARVVWALRYLGHADVRYLDGGFASWSAAGLPVDAGDPPAGAPTGYTVAATVDDLKVDGAYVLAGLGPAPYDTPTIQVIDARSVGEYDDGHIPSSLVEPWNANLAGGEILTHALLTEQYVTTMGLDPSVTTVAYCTAGWRASVTWLVLTWLGFDDVRVYDGSWLEWGAGGFPIE